MIIPITLDVDMSKINDPEYQYNFLIPLLQKQPTIIQQINRIQKQAELDNMNVNCIVIGTSEYNKLMEESLDSPIVYKRTHIIVNSNKKGIWPIMQGYGELEFFIG